MVRPVIRQDRDALESWWRGHGVEPIPEQLLSTDGFIQNGLACVWLFLGSNSKVASLEFALTNPEADTKEASLGLDDCINAACDYAGQRGFNYVVSMLELPLIKKRAEKLGFIKMKDNISTYARAL